MNPDQQTPVNIERIDTLLRAVRNVDEWLLVEYFMTLRPDISMAVASILLDRHLINRANWRNMATLSHRVLVALAAPHTPSRN